MSEEEIAKDIYMHHFDDDVNYPDVLNAITVGVQKGAEFGYNKATEELEARKFAMVMSEKVEKQLRKENEELRNSGFTVSAMTEQQLKAAIEKGTQLEKENAKLKAEIENDRDLPTVAYMQGAENQKKKDEKQLTKATEIIKRLKSLIEDVCDINYLSKNNTKLLEKAEQFLKEIEK